MVFLENPKLELEADGARIELFISRKDAYDILDAFSEVKTGEDYELELKKRSGRRSLNANNYHWVLCEKIAKKLRVSKYEVHNQLMCDYGTDWLDADGKHVYVMMRDDGAYLRFEKMHYRPTDGVEERKGVQYRWFVLLLPSHLMDRTQMSALIDGTVSDAREMGIEIRTPDEIERMKALWNTEAS